LKAHKKRLFIVTNAHYEWTNIMMTFTLGEDWKSYFDFVCMDSNKPSFFTTSKSFETFELSNDNNFGTTFLLGGCHS